MRKRVKSSGKLITNGVNLLDFEQATVDYLVSCGKTITLIPVSDYKGIKTPDFMMDRYSWEMKCPTKSTRSTLEHALRAACKQSRNVVIDLRGIRSCNTSRAVATLKHFFENLRSVRRLLVVTKDNQLLAWEK